MSIFLAFSLQKRLEHILNSMPGYSPPSAPKDPLARRHIARQWERAAPAWRVRTARRDGGCGVRARWGLATPAPWIGLHHQIQALPFPCVNALISLQGRNLQGFPAGGWSICLFASQPPFQGSHPFLCVEPQEEPPEPQLCQPEWVQPSPWSSSARTTGHCPPDCQIQTLTAKQEILRSHRVWLSKRTLCALTPISYSWGKTGSSRVTSLPWFSDAADLVFLLTSKGAPLST